MKSLGAVLCGMIFGMVSAIAVLFLYGSIFWALTTYVLAGLATTMAVLALLHLRPRDRVTSGLLVPSNATTSK